MTNITPTPPTIEEEPILSHQRITINKDGEEINVPVIDVRDGISYRMLAYQITKAPGRSKWIPYNEYQKSHKPKNSLSI